MSEIKEKSLKKKAPNNLDQPFCPGGVLVFPSVSNPTVLCPSQEPRRLLAALFGGS